MATKCFWSLVAHEKRRRRRTTSRISDRSSRSSSIIIDVLASQGYSANYSNIYGTLLAGAKPRKVRINRLSAGLGGSIRSSTIIYLSFGGEILGSSPSTLFSPFIFHDTTFTKAQHHILSYFLTLLA